MRKFTIFILFMLPASAHAADEALVTLRYPLKIYTPFHIPESKEKKPRPADLDGALAAIGIEITEENGKYFHFDGENLYLRATPSDHTKAKKAMETKGSPITDEKEAKVLKILQQRNRESSKNEDLTNRSEQ